MMEIYDCEQRSDEWWKARMGIPTASQFSTVLAHGRGGGESKTRRTYLLKLAGEIVTGQPMDAYTNHHMERGKEMEAEARDLYSFMRDVEPEPVGFIRSGDKGASPDALIDSDGLLEIKTALPHILIDLILKDKFPPAHMAQCQGQLWVSERRWLDLVVYWPGLPLFVKRLERDEDYISNLYDEVDAFNVELAQIVQTVMAYGGKAGIGHTGPTRRDPPEVAADDVGVIP